LSGSEKWVIVSAVEGSERHSGLTQALAGVSGECVVEHAFERTPDGDGRGEVYGYYY
jgi:hypothetical protein